MDPNPASLQSNNRGAWPLYRQWNVAETHHYARWIENIFAKKTNGTREQRLAKLDRVLTDPEMNLLLDPEYAGDPCNPQIAMESIRAMHGIVDCHKLLMSLGAYYSCRRGLPFMISHVRSSDGTDIRTAASTLPVGTVSSFDYASAHQFFVDTLVGTCTGNLRVEPFAPNAHLSDTCPVAITRNGLLPGCAYYLDGHVLVVARVDDNGNIRFLDATTASSRDLYVFNAMNAVTGLTPSSSEEGKNDYSGCFRGFRVLRYPIAETDDQGNVKRVRRRTDEEMGAFGFSTEQYEKMESLLKQGKITESGLTFGSMHQFIRYRMRAPEPTSIVGMLKKFAEETINFMVDRESVVQAAWADVLAKGPIEFPEHSAAENIYTIGGRWGKFSTALSDAEFRGRYFDMLEDLDAAIQWFDVQPEFLNLDGLNIHAIWSHSDLALAAIYEKNRIFGETSIAVTDSKGKEHEVSLLDIEKRFYNLSFDPNHPPELRWGFRPDSKELFQIPESPTPIQGGQILLPMAETYAHEAYYRSLTRREIEETPLRAAATEGFYIRETIDEYLWPKWHGAVSPPLVPHGGKRAYETRKK